MLPLCTIICRLENGTYTGVLGEVVYGRADVSFNSRFLNDPMIHKPYQYTLNNGLDYICFIVPKAETLTRLQILWMTFSVEVWICVAVTYALMTKSFQLFNKLNLSGGRKISDPFMTSLQVKNQKLQIILFRLQYNIIMLILIRISGRFGNGRL